ncbi:MAG TPA: dienelactone hydrolase family protein [Acidimicrobiales bacterium]|jgi:carboxymethylenebutenolidase|nr:dienelactone hydrolase family protein [Acidimicrobiales bacterium]
MSDVAIPTKSGGMPAYLATPDGAGPFPGVVVIHDVVGMSPDVRVQADWLASEGFAAVAPDFFHWGHKVTCIRTVFANMRARRGRVFDDVESTRSWLLGQPASSGQTGVIGYCMGGGFALLLAPAHGFAASSVNYGQVPKDAEEYLKGACPIVGSFGARDRTLKGAAAKLQVALERDGIPHDVKEYPDAGHSFLNQHESVLFSVVGHLMGGGYHQASADDARRRIAEFFRAHLTAV